MPRIDRADPRTGRAHRLRSIRVSLVVCVEHQPEEPIKESDKHDDAGEQQTQEHEDAIAVRHLLGTVGPPVRLFGIAHNSSSIGGGKLAPASSGRPVRAEGVSLETA